MERYEVERPNGLLSETYAGCRVARTHLNFEEIKHFVET